MADKSFKDAGKTMAFMPPEPMMEEEKFFQVLVFDEDMLPELVNWTPGEKYRLEVIVRQQDMFAPEGEDADGEEKPREAAFKVLMVRATGGGLTDEQKKMVDAMS